MNKISILIIVLILLLNSTVQTLYIENLLAHKVKASKNNFHLTINNNHNAFTGLTVDNDLPRLYIQGQYYTITGKINSVSKGSSSVHLIIQQKTTKKRHDFTTTVQKNKQQFSLLVKIPGPGKYLFFLFSGHSGSSDGSIYQVKPFSLQQTNTIKSGLAVKPTNLALRITDNKLYVDWNSQNCSIAKLAFSQSSIPSIIFYLSNSKNYFQVPFAQFWNFKPQNTQVSVSCASSSSNSLAGRNSEYSSQTKLSFVAGYHHFAQKIDDTQISIRNIPWRINLNEKVVISGNVLTNCRNKIYLQIPSRGFRYFYLNSKQKQDFKVLPNSKFSVTLNNFNESGSYLLQINDYNGEAVVNQPIYVGQAYPLLPDYIDLQPSYDPSKILAQTPTSITDKRNLMLGLINSKRKQWGLPQVYLDNNLNSLAQNYAEDMANRRFFGHYNPEGQGPQDRATAMGIQESIGQNVAYNSNMTSGHYALCRSAGHLQNIVGKDWTRVGLGIAFSQSQKTFYIAQQFSTRDLKKFPLTTIQTGSINNQLSSAISSSCTNLAYSAFLTDALDKELKKPKSQQFSQAFGRSIMSEGLSYSRYWISGSYYADFIKNNITPQKLSKSCKNYKKFGVVQSIANGSITVTILFVG